MMHNFMFFKLLDSVEHIECNKEQDKAPTNQVYLCLPAGLSVNTLEDLVRRNRGISAVGLFIKAREHCLLLKRKFTGDRRL